MLKHWVGFPAFFGNALKPTPSLIGASLTADDDGDLQHQLRDDRHAHPGEGRDDRQIVGMTIIIDM